MTTRETSPMRERLLGLDAGYLCFVVGLIL